MPRSLGTSWRRHGMSLPKKEREHRVLGTQTPEGEKTLAIAENHGYILAPYTVRPVNVHDNLLFDTSFTEL